MKAMTLRLSDEMHESVRREAYERRVSMTSIIEDAIEHRRVNGSLGCDVCGEPRVVHVSTPGGFRFCTRHWNPKPDGIEFESPRARADFESWVACDAHEGPCTCNPKPDGSGS